MIKNRMWPVHPGEILREDYLVPLGLSVNALASALHIPATRLHENCQGAPCHIAGYGATTGPLFRLFAAILDEPANSL